MTLWHAVHFDHVKSLNPTSMANGLQFFGQSENGSIGLPDCGDSLDPMTFEQILEMDDDEEEREFSRSIVYGFFDQAEQTFRKMEVLL